MISSPSVAIMTISFVCGKEIFGFLQRFLTSISAKAASLVFDEINAGVYIFITLQAASAYMVSYNIMLELLRSFLCANLSAAAVNKLYSFPLSRSVDLG